MTKDQVPEATKAQLVALEMLWLSTIKAALDARSAAGEGAAVVQVEGLGHDRAILFVGSAVFERLTALRDEGRQVLALGLAESAISRAAEKDLAPSQF